MIAVEDEILRFAQDDTARELRLMPLWHPQGVQGNPLPEREVSSHFLSFPKKPW